MAQRAVGQLVHVAGELRLGQLWLEPLLERLRDGSVRAMSARAGQSVGPCAAARSNNKSGRLEGRLPREEARQRAADTAVRRTH